MKTVKRSKPPVTGGGVTLPPVGKKRGYDKSLAVNILDTEHFNNVHKRYDDWIDSSSSNIFDGFDISCRPSDTSIASVAAGAGQTQIKEVKENELRTIFYAPTENCLKNWRKLLSTGTDGSIDVIYDDLIQSQALEIKGKYDGSIGIRFPKIAKERMGITMPYLNMIVKNVDRYFSFEIQVLDQVGVKRIFKMSNFQTLVRITSTSCSMPMRLDEGWNQVIIDISAFVKDAFGTRYAETTSLQINANVCIRRIYFASNLFDDAVIPNEYKVFPKNTKKKVSMYRKRTDKDELVYRMKDIVVDKFNSADNLLERLFRTTSGYIEITEDTWDKPVLATTAQWGAAGTAVDLPKTGSQRSIKPVDSTRVFDSASFTKGKKLDPLAPPHPTDSIQLDDFEKIHTGVSYIVPNVAHLLEDMSYVYDFLAVASADAIPQASSDTVDDFMKISQSLRDMASFSDVWESKPMVHTKILDLPKDKPTGTEEVLLSGPAFDVKDGIPVHVTPNGDGLASSVAPSMEVINLSVSQQIIAQVRKVERLQVLEHSTPKTEKQETIQAPEKPIPPPPPPSQQKLETGLEPQKKKPANCSDIVQRSNLAIREFASLSSIFLGRVEKSALFRTNFVEAVRRSTRKKSSSEEILDHLRRVSQTWKEITNSLDVKQDIARTFAMDLDANELEPKESQSPTVQAQLKSIVKGIRRLSQEMIRNFSAESVKALSINLEAKAKKMEDLGESDDELEVCFKSKLGKQMERKISSFSLKYYPSSSEIFLPITYTADKKSRRKSKQKLRKLKQQSTKFPEEEGEYAEETIVDEDAFLNFDGINCEAWTDFFKPDGEKDCNLNIRSMSKIWDKFGRDSEKFPVGFEVTPAKESKASGPGHTPSECSDISGNSFHLSNVKQRIPRQPDRGGGDAAGHEHSTEVKYIPFPNPPSPSVSSYESSRESEDGKFKTTCLKKPPIPRRRPFIPMINQPRARGRKIELRQKLTSEVEKNETEGEQEVKVQTQESSTSLTSLESDNSGEYQAMNILKQMCIDGIKGQENLSPHSLRHKHESIFPSDHGFWSPRAMTPNSDSESECSEGSGSAASIQKEQNPETPMTADTATTGTAVTDCFSEHHLSTGPPSGPTTASSNLSPIESSDSFDLLHCDLADSSLKPLPPDAAETAGEDIPEDEDVWGNPSGVEFADQVTKLTIEEPPEGYLKPRKKKSRVGRRKTISKSTEFKPPEEPLSVIPEVIFESVSKWKMSTPIISTTGLTKSTTEIIRENRRASKAASKLKDK